MGMPLASMTGFGRATAQAEGCTITCEIRSVNGRGLDVRSRMTPGYEAVEGDVRSLLSTRLARGSVSIAVNIQREETATEVVVNERALASVLAAVDALGSRMDARRPSIDGLLAIKGVLDTREAVLDAEAEARLQAAILDCVNIAVSALIVSRETEGARIGAVLSERIEEIAALAQQAEAHPSRTREAILGRLTEQVAFLIGNERGLSEDRLHQEALILATKADIREELDRLAAHVKAARELLAKGGPVGRKLDFLSQEFNREANTLCSKSNDVSLTAIGLDLKAAIDQLREQVQNIE